ncbi:MAG: UDP-N-acetylmuramate--L-alanine ligase [Clostridia bacterium]|nr:UDP-N-acetylmuramate--L-alanine ligase [Clostridia bacterium]MBR3485978.1 UDP-N-acetylmuramate--L-alanine ligase [Clostridia bacterium]
MNICPENIKKIHLIGIGGCSMNGLAQILAARGYEVGGSDKAVSPFTERLKELGIPVTIGQKAENVDGSDLVIYSAAIKPENPERMRAKELGIPEMERSVALGWISERFHNVVGIAGCHGKTTITSMLALIAEKGGLDATVHVGGFVEFLKGGTRLGKRDLFITEACEYVESFLTLRPTVALINNIDDDHLDYFKDIDHITDAFRKFVALIPEGGMFIGCTDDPRVRGLLEEYRGRVNELTYGAEKEFAPDYYPENETYDEKGCPSYDLMFRGENCGRVVLHVPGRYNMLNSVAAMAVALSHGTDFKTAAEALSSFQNTRRRFEYYGERDGVRVFHDYAHHPAEIRAAVDSGLRTPHGRLFCVFQCNSYTRAKTLFCGHQGDCFAGVDRVLVPDIYPGREVDDGSVHARDMVAAINEATHNALYLATFEEISDWLRENAEPGDIVVTLGSGDVYIQTNKLL